MIRVNELGLNECTVKPHRILYTMKPKKDDVFLPFDLTQTEYNKTSLHALFNLSFSSIVGYDERQTEWITSAQYESFRVFYLTAFYTVHRARDKTAIRRRFSHKLSIADVFVERVMPKWT